jgi:hypothetical protein
MLKRAGSSFSLRSAGSIGSSSTSHHSVEGEHTTRKKHVRERMRHRQVSWNAASFRGGGGSSKSSSGSRCPSPQTVILLEGDADTPVLGSIECIRGDNKAEPLENASTDSSEKQPQRASPSSLSSLDSSCREVVRIVCRPPSETDGVDEEEELNESSTDPDLVQFLVDSISELVDQHGDSDNPRRDDEHDGAPDGAMGGVLDALSFACIMNPCVGGVSSSSSSSVSGSVHGENESAAIPYRRTKSILRTKGVDNGRSPVEAGILSDRTVSFARLEIHEFGMTLGDHPSAVSGPPVALDYDAIKPEDSSGTRVISVEEYERVRTPRRTRRNLKLSYHDKCATLRDKGFSLQELHDAWAEAILIRKQRHETLKQTYTSMVMDDFWESAGRKYHRVLDTLALA